MLDLASVFDASPNPYMVLDRDLRYVAANRAYLAATGRTLEQLLGRQVIEAFPHDPERPDNDNSRRLLGSLKRVLVTGQPDVLPLIPYRVSGDEVRYWSATHTPIFDAQGRVTHVLQHTMDVTELQRGREALPHVEASVLGRAELVQQHLRRLLRLFDRAPVFLCSLRGPQHTVELANAAYRRLVGEREILGKTLREALPEIDPRYYTLLDEVYRTGEPFVGHQMRVMLQRTPEQPPDEVYVDFVYQPLRDDEGNIDGVWVVGSDVTEGVLSRRRAEGVQAELEAIFESFPEALFVGDSKGIKRINAAAQDILGYATPEQVFRPQPELAAELDPRHPETGEPVPASETPFSCALRGGRSRMEVVIRHRRSGEDRYVLTSGAPVSIGGRVVGAVVTQIDVTERRQVERQALQLARVLDETRDFVGISDLQGKPLFVNRAGRALVGLPALQAAMSLEVAEYFVPSQREYVREHVLPSVMREGYWEGDLRFVHQATGEEIPVRYSVFPLRGDSGQIEALATVTRDLRAQEAVETERARLLLNERAARAQAEQANQLKDQFLATVSHELRTPLTSMLGWMQMLRSGMLPVDKHARALETVERNARIQARLIDDLLDVSRILSGKLSLELELTDLSAVASAAVETVRPVAEAKGVGLAVDIEGTALVTGDARRLQQVVWNLLTNAVKFTPQGGQVLLQLERDGDDARLQVLDTGAGIPADFLPHVFERFRQAEVGPARRLGGLGLGLSIVRHVVEAHKGTVSATSEGEGRGSSFVVRVPLASTGWRHLTPPTPFSAPAALDGLHILVVDDEPDVRELVRQLLQQCRARVSVASNAAEALQLVQSGRPDVLISDLSMPDGDGYHLIAQIRALPPQRGGRTPAVALTAYSNAEDRARAMRAGFQNHVPKPVAPEELVAAVAALRDTGA